ncbi:MAG: non-ribosomal peptide synthetase [Pyrinomonadaceae bacterium]
MKQNASTKGFLPREGQRESVHALGACAHTLFEQQALKAPDEVAIVCGDISLTYEQLNRKANRVAHQLLALGVEPETIVGVSIPRSIEQIVNILGILKAGCAYLPLDPDDPKERLAAIIRDAKVSFLLTKSALHGRFPIDSAKIICIDSEQLGDENSENPNLPTTVNNLAYVMFTSGSTGRPKGVMVEHRSIVRLVKGADYADFGANNVFLQFAPVTFDASTFEIWGALLNGARLAIMPEGVSSLADLGNAISEYGVTTLWLTAGLFHLMVDERIEDLRPLRQLLAGGDVLSVTHVQKFLDTLDCDLINGYGPTENTTFSCTYKVSRDGEFGRSIPIGKPIANTQVFILDEDLNSVNNGEAGELYFGGEGLARGYLNIDEMTTEKFITNPFPGTSSSKLYRSGDLARLRSDGNIEFLGRADKQVKIRGFRIELEEIEIALTRQAGVREAITVAREVSTTEKQLIAFVVPEIQCGADVPLLRKRLEETLPDYMIPSFIVSLDALPLTTNGKVDRNALINMIGSGTGITSTSNKPETVNEQKIAGILEEILNNGTVGRDDNFFDLGANSLQMARFHSRLQAAFDPNIKIVSLFQNPTINSLARSIGSNGSSDAGTADVQNRAARQRAAFARRKQVVNGGIRK